MAHRLIAAVCLVGFLVCGPAQAQEGSRFEGGLRLDVLVADGEPANWGNPDAAHLFGTVVARPPR